MTYQLENKDMSCTVNGNLMAIVKHVLRSDFAKRTYAISGGSYLFVCILIFASIFLNKNPNMNPQELIIFLLILPLAICCLFFFGLCYRIHSASKLFFTFDEARIILNNNGIYKTFIKDETKILYKNKAYVDVVKANNPFISFSIFGHQDFLNDLLEKLKKYGFVVEEVK